MVVSKTFYLLLLVTVALKYRNYAKRSNISPKLDTVLVIKICITIPQKI